MFLPQEQREQFRENDSETLDDASKLLLKAAALIEERGWCQNHYSSADGRLCILGALRVAYGVNASEHITVGSPVADSIMKFSGAVGKWTDYWNDDKGRTQEEVVAKLRAVALGG